MRYNLNNYNNFDELICEYDKKENSSNLNEFIKNYDLNNFNKEEIFSNLKEYTKNYIKNKDLIGINICIEMGFDSWDDGLLWSKEEENKILEDYFISKINIKKPNGNELYLACFDDEGCYCLITKLIKNGADDWNEGLLGVVRARKKDLVKFFIDKGANYFDDAIKICNKSMDYHIREYLIFREKQHCFEIEKNLEPKIIKEVFDDKDWNTGMKEAAKGGHKDLVLFFIEKGANDWNGGMYGAVKGGHKDLVNFFIEKGANKWDWGITGAAKGGHKDLVDFFKNKLK